MRRKTKIRIRMRKIRIKMIPSNRPDLVRRRYIRSGQNIRIPILFDMQSRSSKAAVRYLNISRMAPSVISRSKIIFRRLHYSLRSSTEYSNYD